MNKTLETYLFKAFHIFLTPCIANNYNSITNIMANPKYIQSKEYVKLYLLEEDDKYRVYTDSTKN